MDMRTVPFDIVAELDSVEAISEYLTQVLAAGDSEEIIRAHEHIARARNLHPHLLCHDKEKT